MSITTMSSRQFNQHAGEAKKAARHGPVIIMDRGRPGHVLLSYAEYKKISHQHTRLSDLLPLSSVADIDFEVSRSGGLPRHVELS
jgi:prevent-host-death family protein